MIYRIVIGFQAKNRLELFGSDFLGPPQTQGQVSAHGVI